MKLVFIYGPAASGKLTVARELAERTGFALFHNHLVVDALLAVFPFGSEPFVRLRERFWLDVFADAAAADRSLIFTFAPEGTVAPDFPARVRALVEAAGGEVVFVSLTVDEAEQERRLAAPSREAYFKLKSVEVLRSLRAQFAYALATMPAAAVTIDTGVMQPAEAAQKIADTLGVVT